MSRIPEGRRHRNSDFQGFRFLLPFPPPPGNFRGCPSICRSEFRAGSGLTRPAALATRIGATPGRCCLPPHPVRLRSAHVPPWEARKVRRSQIPTSSVLARERNLYLDDSYRLRQEAANYKVGEVRHRFGCVVKDERPRKNHLGFFNF